VREITTKNGAKMAFVKLADVAGEIELVVFPKVYQDAQILLQRDHVVIAKGKLGSGRGQSNGGDELKLLVDRVELVSLDKVRSYKSKGKKYEGEKSTKKVVATRAVRDTEVVPLKQRLYIRLENSDDQPLLMTLKEKLDGHHGKTEVVLVTGPKTEKQIIKLPQTIDVNEESLRDLASVFGAINVVVR
jgi:DNA polymerase III alpha subunit